MLKKYLVLILMFLVINLSFGATVFAQTTAEKEAKFTEKVKAGINRLGTGKDSKVSIKLKDGTKLKGYIGSINENSFVVVDEKTGVSTEVPYPQTKQVKASNLKKGLILALAIASVLGVILLIGLIPAVRRS
jgi:small nuclear ribonucleoprotein (snRNP)-like protein